MAIPEIMRLLGIYKTKIGLKSWVDDSNASGCRIWWEWPLCCDPLKLIPCSTRSTVRKVPNLHCIQQFKSFRGCACRGIWIVLWSQCSTENYVKERSCQFVCSLVGWGATMPQSSPIPRSCVYELMYADKVCEVLMKLLLSFRYGLGVQVVWRKVVATNSSDSLRPP
jgi:hypothetical protein